MSDYKFAGVNIWTYCDNRAIIWLGGKGSHYGDPNKRHMTYQRGGSRALGLVINVGGEEGEIMLRIGLLFTTLYIGMTGLVKSNEAKLEAAARDMNCYAYELDYASEGRSTGVMMDFHREHAGITFKLWENGSSWTRQSFRRKMKHWPYCEGASKMYFFGGLLGPSVYDKHEDTAETGEVYVAMPEKNYPATVKTYRVTCGRKLWKKTVWRSEIEVEGGIPIPGKGTESYNCGMDATGSITFGVTDDKYLNSEVAELTRKSAQATRDKRGWDVSMLDKVA